MPPADIKSSDPVILKVISESSVSTSEAVTVPIEVWFSSAENTLLEVSLVLCHQDL